MPAYVLIVDVFGVILAVIGFTMAFRQPVVRRIIGRPERRRSAGAEEGTDPLTYILRISGVMVMAFGVAIGGMVTLVHLT
jgi:hypothetical protein